MLPDPNDEMVLETAVNRRADAIQRAGILDLWRRVFDVRWCGRVNRILARVGKGNPPIEGDELLLGFPARKVRKKK